MAVLSPTAVRDPLGDHLITPQNIDYQSNQLTTMRSMDRELLLKNITWVALACELQRDWAGEQTVADVVEIVLTERLLKA